MAEYYIWEGNDERAQAMLDAVNSDPRMPDTMTFWAEELTVFTDGRKGFKRLKQNIMDYLGLTEEEKTAMLEAYGPQIIDKEDLPQTVEESEIEGGI